jgi:GWxTD domain-containing protein
VPQLLDAGAIYRAMGLVVGTPPLPFVASLRFLAGNTPDSTLAVFAMSLANHSLSFRRDSGGFVAEYHVELALGADSNVVRQAAQDATVRVRSFQETLRPDESVVFQQMLAVRPGIYSVSVVVRDRNGPAYAKDAIVDTVPRLEGPGLGWPIPIYQGAGRERLEALPQFVVNPRATWPYGADSLRFYVEGYGLPRGTRLAARVLDPDSVELWHDTLALAGDGPLASAQFVIQPGELPAGRAELYVDAIGAPAHMRAAFLVSFSDQWAITNLKEMVTLLRYFARQDLVAKLKAAGPNQRAAMWREFYKASDPVPLTPENEALDDYFHRVELATRRFHESGGPGWQTDRGEVFITLGEPDEIFDVASEVTHTDLRVIRWEYTSLRLTLFFQDETGFGQYRLTPLSRSEYGRVLERVRRTQ